MWLKVKEGKQFLCNTEKLSVSYYFKSFELLLFTRNIFQRLENIPNVRDFLRNQYLPQDVSQGKSAFVSPLRCGDCDHVAGDLGISF